MASYNKMIMLGNLTRDPVMQGPFCKFTVATNHKYKKQGEAVNETCFMDVDVFGVSGENCQKYLKKGSSVLIEGRLQQSNWTDDKGQKRSKYALMAETVTFVGGKPEDESDSAAPKKSAYENEVLTKYENSKLPF